MQIEREVYARCFSIIYRLGKMMNNNAAKKFDLTGHEFDYTMHIIQNPGISQESLVKYYKIDKGSVAKSVKGMVEKGYVRREMNPKDSRAYCLYPTEKALAILEDGRSHGRAMEQLITNGISLEDQVKLQELLVKVTNNIEKLWEGED